MLHYPCLLTYSQLSVIACFFCYRLFIRTHTTIEIQQGAYPPALTFPKYRIHIPRYPQTSQGH
nr:MAG TPA: hypothetical protein [Caudoviricetes sp.]